MATSKDTQEQSAPKREHGKQGFASMPKEQVREIARKGGEHSHDNDLKRRREREEEDQGSSSSRRSSDENYSSGRSKNEDRE